MTTRNQLPSVTGQALDPDARRQIVERIDEILELTYRSKDLGNFTDPLDEVIYIILSRKTHEAVYQRTFDELKLRWPSWGEVLKARPQALTSIVSQAGFGATRSVQIIQLLQAVDSACRARGHQQVTLDWIRELSEEQALDVLLSLPGVGHKTARCVLQYSLGKATFAVDTHIRRILGRLGIVADHGEKVDHTRYEAVIPEHLRNRLHINLIHHGRAICSARDPDCYSCPLVSFCALGRSREQKTDDDRPVAIELFAGAGGMAEGFEGAGYRVAVAVEANREAAQTYRLNHPGTVVVEADVQDVTGPALTRLVPQAKEATAIIAGPPCQGYSAAGKRRADDIKNALYKHVIRLARQLRPQFIVIENVPGMRRVEGTSFSQAVLDNLSEAGYNARECLLRACDFGVPQLRHRLLFLAQRRCLGPAPAVPSPTHCARAACPEGRTDEPRCGCALPPTPRVVDKLLGLPRLGHSTEAEYIEVDGKLFANASTMRHSDQVVNKIKEIRPGSGPISYRRLDKELAHTIIAGHRALPVHPELDRTMSVREAARIQGFDDGYVFAGPRWLQPLQVANAVPPPLARAVALALKTPREAEGSSFS